MTGCTIALANQLPHARVLAKSFGQHHPGSRFVVFLLDIGSAPTSGPDLEFMSWAAAGFRPDESRQLPMLHDAAQLTAIVMPFLLRQLLISTGATVVYQDVAAAVYAPLAELEALAQQHGLVAAAHPASGGGAPTDAAQKELPQGLIAVGSRAEALLDQWVEATRGPGETRTPRPCGRFVLDDASWDLGFWNLEGRKLTTEGDRYFLDDLPLRCFRFSGYEPRKPHLLSSYQGVRPKILLSENPVLLALCEEYRQNLVEAGLAEAQEIPSGLRFLPSGVRIDEVMRELYQTALQRFRAKTGPEPQSPFSPGGERAFMGWLNHHVGAGEAIVTRYMAAIHAARPDLQGSFPDYLDADAAAFRNWYLTYGRVELHLPEALLGTSTPVEEVAVVARPSINLAGFFRAELGIGEAARLLATALDASGLPYSTVAYDGTVNRQLHAFEERRTDQGVVDINIVCVNADHFISFHEKMGREFFEGRYTIGVWFWEVTEFPREFQNRFNYVDEIWVTSDCAQAAIRTVSPKPVVKIHLPIASPAVDPQLTRSSLGMPEGFCFLFSFDFLSVLERKNPLGVIEAFRRAFKPGEGPTLILKTINGEQRILELEKLKFAVRNRRDIRVVDGYLSSVEKNTLTSLCDCYVSLHRAEGFGLTMAEAMALERPVIATAYSGNLEFMNAANSYLCGYTEAVVGPERQPYPADALWADPDVVEAAALMRHVYDHPEEARERGRRAARDVRHFHSPKAAARSLAGRIEKIRKRLAGTEHIPTLEALADRIEALEASERDQWHRLRTSRS